MSKISILNKLYASRNYPWVVWGLGAAFFCVEYFARLAPSVMINDLMLAFNTDSLGIGILSSWFYMAYLGMQIPVGVFVDRYGANKILVFASLISGLSCFMFALSKKLFIAGIARFLIGFGGAFAFVGTLKLAHNWFPSNKFGLIAGLTQALGMLGATIAEGPLAMLVTNIGWRDSINLIGMLLIIVSVLIFILVKNNNNKVKTKKNEIDSFTKIAKGLKEVIRNKQTWIIGAIAALIYGPTAVFGELWGIAYLENVHNLSHHTAANALSMVFLGWTIGGPLSGFISDKIGRRKPGIFVSTIVSFVSLSAVLLIPNLSAQPLFIILFVYGVFNTGIVNTYALASEINKSYASGMSMALTNINSVILGFAMQPIVGHLINTHWDGKMLNGVKIYSAVAYKQAMIFLPFSFILAFLLCFTVKETYCKRINE